MARALNMNELAARLGVSRTTVSLVVKGEGNRYRIAADTQRRIFREVRRTGYKPNFFASALSRKRSGAIGLVFPDLIEEFMVQGLRGIEDALLCTEWLPIICSSRFDVVRERKQIEELLYRGVDGFLIAPTAHFHGQPRSIALFRRLKREGKPMVFLDRHPAALGDAPRVRQDDRGGGRLAAAYLVAQGSRRPAYIGFDLAITTLPERLRGFEEGLKAAGCTLPASRRIRLRELNPAAQDLETALAAWQNPAKRPDGIFVSTTGLADRCAAILVSHGISPGRDVPLIRFGASRRDVAGFIQGIRQPHQAMGRAAAELLCAWIATGRAPKPGETVLPVHLDETG